MIRYMLKADSRSRILQVKELEKTLGVNLMDKKILEITGKKDGRDNKPIEC